MAPPPWLFSYTVKLPSAGQGRRRRRGLVIRRAKDTLQLLRADASTLGWITPRKVYNCRKVFIASVFLHRRRTWTRTKTNRKTAANVQKSNLHEQEMTLRPLIGTQK